jgi:hypothetical protein
MLTHPTYLANGCCDEKGEPVEPGHVGLQVLRLLGGSLPSLEDFDLAFGRPVKTIKNLQKLRFKLK